MSAASLEAPRPLRKPGDTDAVTFSWADTSAGLFGLARAASGLSAGDVESSSALAIVLSEEGRARVAADTVLEPEPLSRALAALPDSQREALLRAFEALADEGEKLA